MSIATAASNAARYVSPPEDAEPREPREQRDHPLLGLSVETFTQIMEMSGMPLQNMELTCKGLNRIVRGISRIDLTHLTDERQKDALNNMCEMHGDLPRLSVLKFNARVGTTTLEWIARRCRGLRVLHARFYKCCDAHGRYLGAMYELRELDVAFESPLGAVNEVQTAPKFFDMLPLGITHLSARGLYIVASNARDVRAALGRHWRLVEVRLGIPRDSELCDGLLYKNARASYNRIVFD